MVWEPNKNEAYNQLCLAMMIKDDKGIMNEWYFYICGVIILDNQWSSESVDNLVLFVLERMSGNLGLWVCVVKT